MDRLLKFGYNLIDSIEYITEWLRQPIGNDLLSALGFSWSYDYTDLLFSFGLVAVLTYRLVKFVNPLS